MTDLKDPLRIGGVRLDCRLFTGTGKYGDDALIPGIVAASGCEVVTVALRRVDLSNPTVPPEYGCCPTHREHATRKRPCASPAWPAPPDAATG